MMLHQLSASALPDGMDGNDEDVMRLLQAPDKHSAPSLSACGSASHCNRTASHSHIK